MSGLRKAITERDAADLASVLSSKPWLGLYNRVNEGAVIKEYLQRPKEDTGGRTSGSKSRCDRRAQAEESAAS